MEWITHHEFDGKTLCGYKRFCRGHKLEEINGILFDGKFPVCFSNSQVSKEHFSKNSDGQGLKRGDITHYIAFGPKLTELQKSILTTDKFCKNFILNDEKVILFNNKFFLASILELYQICNKLSIDVEDICLP